MTGKQRLPSGQAEVCTALMQLRLQRAMSLRTVAERLGWPVGRVAESEQPACRLTRRKFDQLLDLYQPPRAVRRRLTTLATETGIVRPEPAKPRPARPSNLITAEDAARFRRLYDAGATVKQVAKQTGFGHQRVYRSLRKTGNLRPRGQRPKQRPETTSARPSATAPARPRPAVVDHHSGMTPEAIAAKYGVSLHAVHRWLADAGIPHLHPPRTAQQTALPVEG